MDRYTVDSYKPQPDDTPAILYKYRFFDTSGYHLKVLEEAQLWFTSAREFNDPFDSSLSYQFDDKPQGIQEKWAQDFLKREFPHLNRQQRNSLARQRLREINKDSEHIEQFRQNSVEKNFNKFGICSLTPAKDDLLMWAHYSDYHRGFCVGIDTSRLLDLQNSLAKTESVLSLEKVIYSDDIPIINFFQSMRSDPRVRDQNILTLLCTKSTHWCYEQEFRLIYWDHINTALTIGHDAIAEVVLGCRVRDEDKKKILAILDEKQCSAVVYKAEKHKSVFGLHLEQIR